MKGDQTPFHLLAPVYLLSSVMTWNSTFELNIFGNQIIVGPDNQFLYKTNLFLTPANSSGQDNLSSYSDDLLNQAMLCVDNISELKSTQREEICAKIYLFHYQNKFPQSELLI